jgi:hypothetical protein
MDIHLKKLKINNQADVMTYVLMPEAYAEAEFLDFTYIKHNDTVAKCSDDMFLENFGFLDNLEPFDKRPCFVYDDDTVPLVEDQTKTTGRLSFSDLDTSAGNASHLDNDFDFELEDECFNNVEFNYLGPKAKIIKPRANESPIIIITANTIGCARSRRFFRALCDSGSTVSMIKRSCLPKDAVLKDMAEEESIRTLAGKLKSQQVATMRDIRLPEFDKTGKLVSRNALSLIMTNATMTSSLVPTFSEKLVLCWTMTRKK